MITELIFGVGASVIAGLLIWVIREINSIEKRLEKYVGDKIAKERMESILAHRRLNSIDRIVSKVTERDFDSRNIAEGKESIPESHGAIRDLIHHWASKE